jgi:hypothetical protein
MGVIEIRDIGRKERALRAPMVISALIIMGPTAWPPWRMFKVSLRSVRMVSIHVER